MFRKLTTAIVVTAFFLNLSWEYAQCAQLFVHGALRATPSGMLLATAGDVVLTAALFLAGAAAGGSLTWPLETQRATAWIAVEVLAIAAGIGVERMGLVMGRWSYTPSAPIIPFTSLSIVPVAQLPLLAPLTFWISRKIMTRLR